MIQAIVNFSVRHKLFVFLGILVLLLYGGWQLGQLSLDAVPDITNNQVQVISQAPSLSALDIERLVTMPIERANRNLPQLKELRSFSRFGLSLVTLVFEDGVDPYWARQQVAERLKSVEADLPQGLVSPQIAPLTTGLGEIYQYVLRVQKGYEAAYTLADLRSIQDWLVRPELLAVPGLADVSSFGGHLKQYEIGLDPLKLEAAKVSIQEVFEALAKNNENSAGAYLERQSQVFYMRTEGLLSQKADLEQIMVKQDAQGRPIYLKDLASLRFGHAFRYGAMTYNDEGEVCGGIVLMLKDGNSHQVIDRVERKVEAIQAMLPPGLLIEPFLERSKMVEATISTVKTNLLEGALIVLLVLMLFLGDWRAGLLVASVIPLAMLFAVILMNLFGVSGNLMSLGALDFGLIVDGAVIIVEAVLHGLAVSAGLKLGQADKNQLVEKQAGKMMSSAVFGQVIILIVYLPILSLEGIEGKMFRPMALTVSFALIGAFILSLTYVPMMSSLLLKQPKVGGNLAERGFERLAAGYRSLLSRVLPYPKTILGLSLAGLIGAFSLFGGLGAEFIPNLPEGDFAVEMRVLSGSDLPTTIDAGLKAAGLLKAKFPEVEKIVTKIGSSEIPVDPMPIDAADLIVVLKHPSTWTSAQSWPALADSMGAVLADIPGVSFGFQYPVAMRFNELISGAKQDVACKIFGENLDSLAHYAQVLGQIAAEVPGVADLYIEPIEGLPQLVLRYDRLALGRYGLDVQTVNRIVNTAFAGQVSGLVYEGEKRFDLVLRLLENKRQKPEDLENLLIQTPQGQTIPLRLLAQVTLEDSPNQIQRENARRRVSIGFNVRGRDVQTVVQDLQARLGQKLRLASGYALAYGGAFENLQAAQARLSLAVPLALGLILLLLYLAFNSLRQSLLIYSAIPLSMIGGILALWLRGLPFSISAGVGFIALFGVAVLNGIVLLAEFNHLQKTQAELALKDRVLDGAAHRLRPVLMTATVASLGFLPMALSQGAGAEVQRPLATVVIGGLLLATLLTLFVLPSLYCMLEQRFNKSLALLALVLGLSQLPNGLSAQTPLSLDSAKALANTRHGLMKREALLLRYETQLKATYLDLPATQFDLEYGQINSAYLDQGLILSQGFQMPQVYRRRKAFQEAKIQGARLRQELRSLELERELENLYNDWAYRQAQKALLQTQDSLLNLALERVRLRLSLGEQDYLEQASMSLQQQQLRRQLQGLEQELELLRLRLQWLTQGETSQEPSPSPPLLQAQAWQDSARSGTHLSLELWAQNQVLQNRQVELEQAALLPSFNLSYSNRSIQGIGADDQYYSSATRFQALQLGVAVPIWQGPQKARLQAAKTQALLAQEEYQLAWQERQTQYRSAWLRYQTETQQLLAFEQEMLPLMRQTQTLAELKLGQGDINYLDWMLIRQQVLALQSQYLDRRYARDQAIIELNYLDRL